MPDKVLSSRRWLRWISRIRRAFAHNLALNDGHKTLIYEQLSESVSLNNISFWLEVIFAAGIATLGLVLNSPAVIIGAMVISPLMGSILANGLALAVGDVVLALRSALNLVLSCSLAILLAMVLVFLLPFQEVTSEIAARTNPTLLDLLVALFSGAVGSVATCKQVKGIAASLPGVAIAVALMPPLCVVGYGLGTAWSSGTLQGLTIAQGGGLLFFTNLVAIIFTAMVVFFLVHFETPAVREHMQAWKAGNRESLIIQNLLSSFPQGHYLKKIGGLPARFLLIVVTMVAISFPLTQSLQELRQEVVRKRASSDLRNQITEVWQQTLGSSSSEDLQAYINKLTFTETANSLNIQLQILTNQFYSDADKQRFLERLATALRRTPDSINLNLVEIPTSQLAENLRVPNVPAILPPPISELQAQLLQNVGASLETLSLPSVAELVTYQLELRPQQSFSLDIIYLAPRELQADAQALLSQNLRQALGLPQTSIRFTRLHPNLGKISPSPTSDLSSQAKAMLDKAGQTLQRYPSLQLVLEIPALGSSSSPDLISSLLALQTYLEQKWQIPRDRLREVTTPATDIQLRLETQSGHEKNGQG
ncbi:DUF389 domain-containing protein [Synechocystis sp. LKSZ1]|uniref:DUF389 domain-containing protein n=1 Tax=Synechocystis sp. LKSZ1 TaxID=3144951 RepID=UPI00336BED0B